MSEDCSHLWIPNSGLGGEPRFERNRQLSGEPTMHAMCEHCGAPTWFTEEQWWEMPSALEVLCDLQDGASHDT